MYIYIRMVSMLYDIHICVFVHCVVIDDLLYLILANPIINNTLSNIYYYCRNGVLFIVFLLRHHIKIPLKIPMHCLCSFPLVPKRCHT